MPPPITWSKERFTCGTARGTRRPIRQARPSAAFSCFENSTACQFGFQYHARHQGLKFHHWYDVGKGAGTFLKERFHGDIANT